VGIGKKPGGILLWGARIAEGLRAPAVNSRGDLDKTF